MQLIYCPQCGLLLPAGARACPRCGRPAPVQPPPPTPRYQPPRTAPAPGAALPHATARRAPHAGRLPGRAAFVQHPGRRAHCAVGVGLRRHRPPRPPKTGAGVFALAGDPFGRGARAGHRVRRPAAAAAVRAAFAPPAAAGAGAAAVVKGGPGMKASVIIPNLNGARWLRDSIESIWAADRAGL